MTWKRVYSTRTVVSSNQALHLTVDKESCVLFGGGTSSFKRSSWFTRKQERQSESTRASKMKVCDMLICICILCKYDLFISFNLFLFILSFIHVLPVIFVAYVWQWTFITTYISYHFYLSVIWRWCSELSHFQRLFFTSSSFLNNLKTNLIFCSPTICVQLLFSALVLLLPSCIGVTIEGQKHNKNGTSCMQWGTNVQKVMIHFQWSG